LPFEKTPRRRTDDALLREPEFINNGGIEARGTVSDKIRFHKLRLMKVAVSASRPMICRALH
jgi:hypothetical protein